MARRTKYYKILSNLNSDFLEQFNALYFLRYQDEHKVQAG